MVWLLLSHLHKCLISPDSASHTPFQLETQVVSVVSPCGGQTLPMLDLLEALYQKFHA